MRIAIIALLTLAAAASLAAPVEWPAGDGGNGHYYEVVTTPSTLTWDEADAQAHAMSHAGTAGHLVTITSHDEYMFVWGLDGMNCDLFAGTNCQTRHIGGWYVTSAVIDPRPYNPPYVQTTDAQWITGETGDGTAPTIYPNAFVDGPVGDVLHFAWGIYDLDGFGYPDFGPHAKPGESSDGYPQDSLARGYIVEYDGLPTTNYPDPGVPDETSSWGAVKSLFR